MENSSFVFSNKKINGSIALVLLAWTVFVFYRYFPFPADFPGLLRSAFSSHSGHTFSFSQGFKNGGRSVWIFFTALAISWLTVFIGRKFREWLQIELEDSWLDFSAEFSLGVLALSFLWLGLGLVHLWFESFLKSVFLLILLAAFLKKKPSSGIFIIPLPKDKLPIFLCIISLIYFGFSFLHGFLPEVHVDGLVYHLGTPNYWLRMHGVADFPSQPLSGFPYGGELFFFTGFLIQGSEAAKLLNVMVLGVCALAAGGWARKAGGQNAGWLAFGLTLTLPLLNLVSWTSQIEGLLTLFFIHYFHGLYRLSTENQPDKLKPLLWLTGLCGGMTLAIKYISVLGVIIGLLVYLFFQKNRETICEKKHLFLGLVLLLLGIPGIWLFKNWTYTANPFYPYFGHWIGGRQISQQASQWILEASGFSAELGSKWKLPWTLLMSKPSLFGFAGPLLLVMVPALFLIRFRKAEWRWAVWTALLLGFADLAVSSILKFHLPEILFIYILGSAVLCRVENPWLTRAAFSIASLSALLCFPYLTGMSAIYYSGWDVWAGRESHDEYLSRVMADSYYPACRFVSDELPVDSKVLIAGDGRGAYYSRSFYLDLGYETPFLASLFSHAKDLNEVQLKIREAGFTHIVVNVPGGIGMNSQYPNYNLTSSQWRLFDEYFSSGLDILYSKDGLAVYQIRPELKLKRDLSAVDPFLFLSTPAISFVEAARRGDRLEASRSLAETVRLYPFSKYWQSLAKNPERAPAPRNN